MSVRHRLRALTGVLFCLVLSIHSSLTATESGFWKPWDVRKSNLLRLQDFCTFRYKDCVYVAAMKKDYCDGIAIGRTKDFIHWEYLGDAITIRPDVDDYRMVWAPHIIESKGTWYMFYTGVSIPGPNQWCQKIYAASTTNPDDPGSWKRLQDIKFMVDGKTQSWFRPNHSGSVWSDAGWADCRDPMVLKHGDTWYMFYSGADRDGGITGVATAPDILGPWTDRGAVLKVKEGIPESCFVLETPDKSFVMVFNHAGVSDKGIKTARARSILSLNGSPSFSDVRLLSECSTRGLTGWAHEFLPDENGGLTAAYLTGYWVNFCKSNFSREVFGWTVTE